MDSTLWKYTYILVLIAFSLLLAKQINHRRVPLLAVFFNEVLFILLILSGLSVCFNIMFDFISQFDHQTRAILYLGLAFALASFLLWNDQILHKSQLPKVTSHFVKVGVAEEKLLITSICFSLAQWCLVPNYVLGPSALVCVILMILSRTSAEQG